MSGASDCKFPSYGELENMKGEEIYAQVSCLLGNFLKETGSNANVIYASVKLYSIFAIKKIGDKSEGEIIINALKKNDCVFVIKDRDLRNTIRLSNRTAEIEYRF